MGEALPQLYADLALPPTPMHFLEFLRHGGTGLVCCTMAGGQVLDLPEESMFDMVKWAVSRGPDEGEARGAKLPLSGESARLAKEIVDGIKAKVESEDASSRGVWREGVRRMRAGDHMAHIDRFKLAMSMIRAGWSDESIIDVFRHASNFDYAKTKKQLDHARRKYGGG